MERAKVEPGYKVRTIAIGTNTDPYQPVERRYRIMRRILEVLSAANHPVGIVTKSALVLYAISTCSAWMAERGLVKVALSVTTLDRKLARVMKLARHARQAAGDIAAAGRCRRAGLSHGGAGIRGLTDTEMERILERAASIGVKNAGYVLQAATRNRRSVHRMVKGELPDRANRVLSLMRSTRGGKLYDAKWGERMVGEGAYAWIIGRRFEVAAQRLGLDQSSAELSTDRFTPPALPGQQLSLL